MYAKAGGWKFDEEQGIGITSEYSLHTYTPNKILINYKGKKSVIVQ